MKEVIREFIESTGGKWTDELEVAYIEFDRVWGNYIKAVKVDFSPVIYAVFKAMIDYNHIYTKRG